MGISITTNKTGSLDISGALYQSETLNSTAAITWVKGTLLGRVTASGKLTAYTSGATNGSQTPIAVLSDEVVFAAAADKKDRVLIGGNLRLGGLVAHGVGAISVTEKDALRSYGIIAVPTQQLSTLDNQ